MSSRHEVHRTVDKIASSIFVGSRGQKTALNAPKQKQISQIVIRFTMCPRSH